MSEIGGNKIKAY